MNADHALAKPFELKGGRHACLVIHGFTGTPAHMRPLAEALNRAGYSVHVPLLPGHGATLEQMRRTGWRDWLAEVRTEYARMRGAYDRVTVMGLSMGGVLALILAEEYPVDGCVCLSAPMRVQDRLAPFSPLIAPFVHYVRWKALERPGSFDFLKEFDLGYDGIPVKCVGDLNHLISLARHNLFEVVAPLLVVQPVNDETVRPVSAQIIMKGVSSEQKQLVWLNQSGHLCTLGPDRELVFESVLKFLKSAEG